MSYRVNETLKADEMKY